MKERLKKQLDEKRYIHSIGVADEAARLAKIYGADSEKAYTAGLLHDCAKGYSIEEQLTMCEKLGIDLDSASIQCTPVIHSFLGVEIAKKEYGISDEEILGAIKYHTVGRAGMTLLEKIVYIADITEINRDFDGVEELRKTAYKDLDEAVLLSIKQQFVLQTKRRSAIHPNMLYMWNDLIKNRKEG